VGLVTWDAGVERRGAWGSARVSVVKDAARAASPRSARRSDRSRSELGWRHGRRGPGFGAGRSRPTLRVWRSCGV